MTTVWGVEVEYPEPKPIKPINVAGHLFVVANAVITGPEDAESVRASAEEFATYIQNLLIELSQIGNRDVDLLLDKYISRL